jgi:hypothetical protein
MQTGSVLLHVLLRHRLLPQPGGFERGYLGVLSARSFADRSTLVSGMSRTTSKGEPIAHAMTTDNKARAGRRARRLNERRRSESFRWEVRELPDGRFEVVALAKG